MDVLVGYIITAAIVMMCFVITLSSSLRAVYKWLLIGGAALRIFGGTLYYGVHQVFYGGGDYLRYADFGATYAEMMWAGDWSFITDQAYWITTNQWWGTQFTCFVTGFIMAITGDSTLNAFIISSLIGYLGLVAIFFSFKRSFPHIDARFYLAALVLLPSLWFWPSALGKDSLMLLGVGLAMLGAVGKRGKVSLFPLIAGIALVFAVRAQVAAVLMVGMAFGHILGRTPKDNVVVVWLQRLAIGVAAAVLLVMSSGALGVDLFSADEVESYVTGRYTATSYGGGSISSASDAREASPWLAPINTLFRPFVWEAHNVAVLLASLETMCLWLLIYARRREATEFILRYRKNRLACLAFAFVLVYAIALGLAVGNLSILTRQRVHILPFVLFLLALPPVKRSKRIWRGGALQKAA